MTFVHPLLLGGLVLIGVPVLLHLIMRQKPKHLLFPALRLLVQRYRLNQRKLRLRHLLLLLLRMLLIAAICLALARPKILSEQLQLASGQPVAAVLVIDTSPSMGYVLGGKTRLDEAKQRALELLEELPEGSRVAILDTAGPAPSATVSRSGEWLNSLAIARQNVGQLQLRPGNGSVTRQIEQAYRLFEKAEQDTAENQEPLPRVLYVFSDRTEESWELNRLKDLQRLRDRVQPKPNAVFVDLGVDEPADFAIVNAKLRRQSIPANQPVTIDVTVRATGKRLDGQLTCRIMNENRPDLKPIVETKAVVLEAGHSQVVTFQRGGFQQGVHQVELTLEPPDAALPFNNARFATFEVRGPRQVLILADEPRDAADLSLALQIPSLPGGAFRCVVKPAADASKLVVADRIDPENSLTSYQAVCLLNMARPDEQLWQKLHEYVQKAGGLAIIPGKNLDPAAYNGAKAQELLPGKLDKIVAADDERGIPWETASYNHPVIAPFKEWSALGNVDFVRFPPKAFRYWGVVSAPSESVIVRYADKEKRPALLERHFDSEKVRGRALLFTTAMDSPSIDVDDKGIWNDYFANSFFLVLPDKTIGYLAGNTEDVTLNFSTGQEVPIALPEAARAQAFTLQGPGLDGSDVVAADGNGGSLRITQAEAAGNYTLRDAERNTAAGFSLNVPPGESNLNRLDPKTVEELLGPDSLLAVAPKSSLPSALQSRWNQPVELFPWLMIVVLLALAIENLLANKFYRREPTEEPQP